MKNRKRNRKLNYDYSRDNLYFVTICVQDRRCCFGWVEEIAEGIENAKNDLSAKTH